MRFAYLSPLFLLIVANFAMSQPPRAVPAARPDEPRAKTFSLGKSADFLDTVTLSWMRSNQCFSCHTGYPYLLARTSLGDAKAAGLLEARRPNQRQAPAGDTHRAGPHVGVAAGQRLLDLEQGKLDAVGVRRYYGAVYAALGVGHAPEGYARSDAAKEGVARLLRYFENTPAPDLHHKTYLLWASLALDGLMDKAERLSESISSVSLRRCGCERKRLADQFIPRLSLRRREQA